ncbi:MAG: Hpt domain-containing protein [Deltaproteobacteria bacterium]|nr:Hpt domain-containing protein [Deltaproteobacteria bacterium]
MMTGPENRSDKIFDKEALMSRLCDDEDLVSEVVEVYLEDTPHQIESLRDAHQNGDQDRIVRQGHTIKGASSNISAMRMQQTAYEIEEAGKSGDLGKVSELLGTLEEHFHELQEYLSR